MPRRIRIGLATLPYVLFWISQCAIPLSGLPHAGPNLEREQHSKQLSAESYSAQTTPKTFFDWNLRPSSIPQVQSPSDRENFIKKVDRNVIGPASMTVKHNTPRRGKDIPSSPVDYIIEMMPRNSEKLQRGQWIFFRVCTVSPQREQSSSTHQTFGASIRQQLLQDSCVPHDPKRPRLQDNQQLVISVHGEAAITYRLHLEELVLTSSVFEKRDVRFWSAIARSTILFALRLSSRLEHEVIDIHVEQPVDLDNVWREDLTALDSWFGRPDLQSADPAVNERGQGDLPTRAGSPFTYHQPLQITHLKRFIVRFSDQVRRLELRCNKTDLVVLFEPYVEKADYEAWSTVDLTGTTHPVPNPAGHMLKHELFDGSRLVQGMSSSSTNRLVLDTVSPDPVVVDELMDELAIVEAQRKLQPGSREFTTPLPPDAQSDILVPSEPTVNTPVHVVELGESVKFTCRGLQDDRPLRVIYDKNIWRNVSYTEQDSMAQLPEIVINMVLKASAITWANLSKHEPNTTPESVNQLTSVKCGSQRRDGRTTVGERGPLVAELYLSIVPAADYRLLSQWIAEKHGELFGTSSFNTETRLEIASFSNPDQKQRENWTEAPQLGFWNLPLARLSGVKLATSLLLVILIISLILVAIGHYSTPSQRNHEYPPEPCVEPELSWSSGDPVQTPVIQQRRRRAHTSWYRALIDQWTSSLRGSYTNARSDSMGISVASCDTHTQANMESRPKEDEMVVPTSHRSQPNTPQSRMV